MIEGWTRNGRSRRKKTRNIEVSKCFHQADIILKLKNIVIILYILKLKIVNEALFEGTKQ